MAKAQLINCLEGRKIPITCGSAGCKPPRPCGLEDCKLLLSNTEFEKGLRQSLMHYLAGHASQLGRCPSEGCPQVGGRVCDAHWAVLLEFEKGLAWV
eukprot:1154601-Pelagomonas_calceolata.AAC.7